ncbi:hypothetical protein PSN01_02577 [Micromonospora saelicesensis]|nr:hypothetical protein PSN01_02577 [Micromonospora saelicesensis]
MQSVVAVQVEAELNSGAPLGVLEQQYQQFAVPSTQPDPSALEPQLRLVPAERGHGGDTGFRRSVGGEL